MITLPTDLSVLTEAGSSTVAVPLTGLYGLVLRYGGLRDITFWLRQAGTAPWRQVTVRAPVAPGSSALGPSLKMCRDAVEAALGSAPQPQADPDPDRSGLADGQRSYEVAVATCTGLAAGAGRADGPAQAGGTDLAATSAPAAEPVFVFRCAPESRWSVLLRLPTRPADPESPGRILAHLATFVRACATWPRARVGQVSYLSDPELQTIRQVNSPPRSFGGARSLHGLVAESARHYPEAVAVIQGARRITFRQLDLKANALAAGIIARGIRRGDRVGILATRSPEYVLAVIAVLKAGAAYVALDPLLPAARLRTLFRISRVRLLLAESAAKKAAADLTGEWVIVPRPELIAAVPGSQLRAPLAEAADLAFISFTSGSSGTPKGVLLDHGGRVNLIADLNDRLGVGPADRVLASASPSFDLSALEIFGTLAAGAAVVLPERGREFDLGHWADLVRTEHVTFWHCVPPVAAAFLQAWSRSRSCPGPGMAPLRVLLLGGDWIPADLPARSWAAFPGVKVYALGGSTEASVCTTIQPVTSISPDWRVLPYGRALANQVAYILDSFGQLAAPDLAGELAIGGAGVAWGYDGLPGRTAERFVPDLFGPVPGGRLYRTGDSARLRPEGYIELLGRLDDQVKIDGVRIEPGEIQACLRRQPDVADAVVVPCRDYDGQVLSIVAFVVITVNPVGQETGAVGAVPPGPPDTGDPWPASRILRSLRARVAAELPRAMVPQRILALGSLPVTPNGKIDMRQLAELAREADRAGAPGAGQPPGEPADEIVRGVAEVWSQVLGLDRPPAADTPLAELGGGSLEGMQVASRLNARFSADIRLSELFEAGTIADLAGLVRAKLASPGRPGARGVRQMPALVRRPGS